MKDEIWILGATGRSGRAVASRLTAAGVALVLAGRSQERLQSLAADLGGHHRIISGTWESQLAALAEDAPAVVVNTVGPFTESGLQVVRACPPGTHYVDLANEFAAVDDILRLDDRAKAAGQVLVTGAGYGVLATESVVLRLCADQPRPVRVRVDALPALALDGGRLGAALAGSIVEVLAYGGREVRAGRLVRSATAAHLAKVVTPDGDTPSTGGGANGELLAAWRASQADEVIAASMAAPTNVVVRRGVLPLLELVIRIPGVARVLRQGIARIKLSAAAMSRRSSWAHARVEWSSGRVGEGWLRVGDAGEFTADVMAGVALRLHHGDGQPGSYTPGALFGPELVEAFGGEFTIS
jgi:short subunit dehydrogenase-like uncharacterized protein